MSMEDLQQGVKKSSKISNDEVLDQAQLVYNIYHVDEMEDFKYYDNVGSLEKSIGRRILSKFIKYGIRSTSMRRRMPVILDQLEDLRAH